MLPDEVREAVEYMDDLILHYEHFDSSKWTAIKAHLLAREAEVERLQRALERSECYHRCSRIHPHCQLKIARIIAPDNLWRWHVTMPDGHIFATSGAGNSFQTLDECMADAQTNGREWLEKADAIWRDSHPRITAHLSENSRGND